MLAFLLFLFNLEVRTLKRNSYEKIFTDMEYMAMASHKGSYLYLNLNL